METALQIVSYFSDVRHVHIPSILVIILPELKIHLLSEEKFQEEVHYLRILLLLEIVVRKHSHTATHHQLPPTLLVLVDTTDRTVAWIGQWS